MATSKIKTSVKKGFLVIEIPLNQIGKIGKNLTPRSVTGNSRTLTGNSRG